MIVKMMLCDFDLLAQYAREKSEDAFTALVRRHLGLVYSAALRQVRSPHLAEEVAQSVFADLARSAGKLKPNTILAAWLYQVTRRTSVDVIRRDCRRQTRERMAQEMAYMNPPASDWTQIEPLLDQAMEALEESDRSAVVLRYFENKSLREVGQTLGTSEDAAQKRVSRAVERLREFFAKRGLAVGASSLAALLSANAVQSAPLTLVSAVASTAALSGAAVQGTIVTQTVAMTTLQKTVIAAMVAAAVGTAFYEARQTSQLKEELRALQVKHAPLVGQVQELDQQRQEVARKLNSAQQEIEQLRRDTAELAKLRGELARLRAEAREWAQLKAAEPAEHQTEAAAKSWLSRVSLLKQRLEQMPDAKIPALQFLTEREWLDAAREDLQTEDEYRKAMSHLRNAAHGKVGQLLQAALKQYLNANNSQWPTDLAQLRPYFESPIGDAVLQRWEILPADQVPNVRLGGDWIITQKGPPVDEAHDQRLIFGPPGSHGSTFFRDFNTAAP